MAYIVPRVLIKQEFTQQAIFSDSPLSALIIGPQFDLYRYAVANEKQSTAVVNDEDSSLGNEYQFSSDVTYSLPSQRAGSFVDKSFVKVFMDSAVIKYLPTDLTVTADLGVARVAVPSSSPTKYYSNRFVADDLVFATGNEIDRTADFSNRDVKAGDLIELTPGSGSSPVVKVKVKGLHATQTAASITTPGVADANNAAVVAVDTNNVYVGAALNNVPTDEPVDSGTVTYVGHIAKGVVTDTYTIEAVVGGLAGDTARKFKITSLNGAFPPKLNQSFSTAEVLTVDNSDGNTVKANFSLIDTVAGDKWTKTIVAAVVASAAGCVASGTYTGTKNLIYNLKVVRGGPWYTGTNGDVCAQVSVTSSDTDSSRSVNVAISTDFNIGSYGAKAQFQTASAAGGLILGDIYHVTVTAAAPGEINIIETYESLPADLVDGSIAYSISEMDLVKDISVPQEIPGDEVNLNWEVDDVGQTITVYQGIQTTDNDLVIGDTPANLEVIAGDIFVEHRDLVTTHSNSIGSVTSLSEVVTVLGQVDVQNPLAQGVYDAVLNAQGVPVYFGGVPTNDLAGYNSILGLAEQRTDYYSIVPMTFDSAIQDAVVAHVNALSTPELAKWRVTWLSKALDETTLKYDLDSEGVTWKATFGDDPESTSTTANTLVTVAGASFVTDGIRAGDKVLTNFRYDVNGNLINDSYIVSSVRTETTLVLVSGPAAPISIAQKVQVARVFDKDEQINNLAAVGSGYNNRRVRAVFPPTCKNGSIVKEGFFLAAALAGLRSGVVPHQGLTNSQVLGFTDLSLAVFGFTQTQLNRLAESGYLIVTQNVVGGTPYVRHQLTTDSSSLNTSEDSITTNVDSISYGLAKVLAPYVGIYNINPNAVLVVRAAIVNELDFRKLNTLTARAGNQLNGYTIDSFAVSAAFKDRLEAVITIEVPAPLNFISITLLV